MDRLQTVCPTCRGPLTINEPTGRERANCPYCGAAYTTWHEIGKGWSLLAMTPAGPPPVLGVSVGESIKSGEELA